MNTLEINSDMKANIWCNGNIWNCQILSNEGITEMGQFDSEDEVMNAIISFTHSED